MSMDIDVVVLWVDGNDPAWQAEKQKYSGKKTDDNNAAHRFRDWGLMQYWFRGIETFLPWVRKVHFVTWGHLPPFLNTDQPKLHIVRHEDYMPKDALPTFSSHALEANIHRIPGLAEHFIYCNDDMFFTRPLKAEQFFDEKTGLPRAQFCELPCIFKEYWTAYTVSFARNMSIINKWFPKEKVSLKAYWGKYLSRQYPMGDNIRSLALKLLFPTYYTGFRAFHSPIAFRKSTFEEVWDKEEELLTQTTLNRFRAIGEPNPVLFFWWQMVSGQFMPGKIDNEIIGVTAETLESACRDISSQAHDMICVNDPDSDIDFDACCAKVNSAFEKILPVKCSFEK